jgi:hypothetical protein
MKTPEMDGISRSLLSGKEAERYFQRHEMLLECSRLFEYSEENDRAVAIVGPAFLDTLLGDTLAEFMVDDEGEVNKLLQPDGPLGTYGSRVTACYCLGLIGEIVTADLRLVGKIRNRFAHDIRASFADQRIIMAPGLKVAQGNDGTAADRRNR